MKTAHEDFQVFWDAARSILNCLTLKMQIILRHIREHFTQDTVPLALPGNQFPTVTCSMTMNSLMSVKLLHIFSDSAGWNSVTTTHCVFTGVKKNYYKDPHC